MKPTRFQYGVWMAALTAAALAVLAWLIYQGGALLVETIAFLSPVLVPLAVAGILAYLLDPVVSWLARRRVPRTGAVMLVFAVFLLGGALLALGTIPALYRQGVVFAKSLPSYSARAQRLVTRTLEQIDKLRHMPLPQSESIEEAPPDPLSAYASQAIQDGITWLGQKAPEILLATGNFLKRGTLGALGAFGFLLSLVLVPIFLFFFLKEGPHIAATWSNYLPLRASPLKSEVVSLLMEINGYLINFFRGQLLVSLIDGLLIAIALLILGMDFAVLIGLLVGILGLIPYAGIIMCWIPAVLIAVVQYGDWFHPLLVTIIFIGANNLDGLLIAPNIVGESVGLHPLTVIVSVLAWSLVLGGLLGALLAVPLTATLKVVLKRYFWDNPISLGDPSDY